ncbi:hypothetical protein Droror1_Dr00019346 [Drosera rotundifolia]
MDSNSKEEHILMLPFPAMGHLNPFLEFAKRLIQITGFTITITILNTPINIHYLRSKLASDQGSSSSRSADVHNAIRFVELPFCSSDHGLPPNVENTRTLIDHNELEKLLHASTALEGPLRSFIEDQIIGKTGHAPLCVVADVFFGWAVGLAKSLGSVGITFSTCGAYGTAAYISMWEHLPHRHPSHDGFFALPGFPQKPQFHVTQITKFLRAADGSDSRSRFFKSQISHAMGSSGWLVNTVEEMEPLGLSILRNYLRLPVWPIGPMLPSTMLSDSRLSNQDSPREECMKWLDGQPTDSIVYISFGSQNSITPAQMMQLAMGLEENGASFLWVIRPPIGFDPDGEFKDEWLPKGFEDRVWKTTRGMLIKKWAPQMEILSHTSTSAFLSHCGWNSILESLSQGVPIIGWPLGAEQAYNSKMLEDEMGVSVELARGFEDNLTKEKVKAVVELVLARDGKGGEMKKAAVEARKQLRAAVSEQEPTAGSSFKAVQEFLQTVQSIRQKNQA